MSGNFSYLFLFALSIHLLGYNLHGYSKQPSLSSSRNPHPATSFTQSTNPSPRDTISQIRNWQKGGVCLRRMFGRCCVPPLRSAHRYSTLRLGQGWCSGSIACLHWPSSFDDSVQLATEQRADQETSTALRPSRRWQGWFSCCMK